MRKFIDLHIIPNPNYINNIMKHAVRLGFNIIGVTTSKPKVCNIDIATRLDISPQNQEQLNTKLKISRRSYEVISVICQNKRIARQAAKDNRVDIIKFPKNQEKRWAVWLDHHQANLMTDSGCCYEIDVKDLLIHDNSIIENRLRRITREVQVASKFDIPIIASSGARTSLEMREPRAIASILTLLGISEDDAMLMVSENPWSIISRNRARLSQSYIIPGVWSNTKP
jgi:RNase P/RNase MRP subunit p30